MSKWPMVRLGDCVKVCTGKLDVNAGCEDGKYPFFTCSKEPYRINEYSFECECVLLAGNGDLNVKYYDGRFNAYQRTYVIESANKGKLLVKYLFYFMLSYIDLLRLGSIGGVIKYIKLGDITEAKIPLPPLEEQKRIAAMLDKAQSLIDLRKKQIAEMDALVKAKFIEMFGDVINNDREWEVKPIKDFALVKIGPFGSLLHAEDYVENGIPLVNPSHIIDGEIVTDPKLTLTAEKYAKMAAYALKPGDLVLGRRGEIGRCAVVDNSEYLCGTGSMLIRIKHSYLPMVLQRIISSEAMRSVLERKAVGVTMMNLNAGMIADLEVIAPPLTLQNRFVDFVRQADKSKLAQQKGLEQLRTLYNALMQQAFN